MIIPHIGHALRALGCDGGWKIKNGKISGWTCKTPQPSDEAIQAKLAELQAEYDSKKYQRDRLAEYPSIQECIHAILDDDLTALQAKRKLVKEKYPKP